MFRKIISVLSAAIWIVIFVQLGVLGWLRAYPPTGTTYYISPTGNDANPGTQVSPWLSPNHAVNCGDTIERAAGAYDPANFGSNDWGTVSNCPTSNGMYFAKLTCAGPYVSSCIYTTSSTNAMLIDKSNWEVIGGKYTTTASSAACVAVAPSTAANIHHIAVVNVIAKGCTANGVTSYTGSDTTKGVDYLAIVGAIAFDAADATNLCFSGFSVYEPVKWDSTAGTHIYAAGLFGFNNIDPDGCAGGANSDGEGITFDDWGHVQNTGVAYDQQGVIEQSLFVGNGAGAVVVDINTSGTVRIQNVTGYGNAEDTHHTSGVVMAELNLIITTSNITAVNNIWMANRATQGSDDVYAIYGYQMDNTNTVDTSYSYNSATSNYSRCDSCSGFSFGASITNATPNFVSTPAIVSTDVDCATSVSVTECMAPIITAYTAQAGGAATYGYKPPGVCAPNAYYPTWLKGAIPDGLITKPCGM